MDINATTASIQDFHQGSSLCYALISGHESDQEVPAKEVSFLYVLPLMSDNWRFKKVPGDSFGLTFAFIINAPFSTWPLSPSISSFIPGGALKGHDALGQSIMSQSNVKADENTYTSCISILFGRFFGGT